MFKKLGIYLYILVILFSCTKNKLGGNSSISGKVEHHEKPIPNAIVYIKFNSKEFPGKNLNNYDSNVKADGDGNFSFNCYKGDYFLYSEGLDIQPSPNQSLAVSGGLAIKVRTNEKVIKNISVTE
jgi:hypothetical protein